MRVLMLGLNHRTADVSLRERAAFTSDDVPAALRQLQSDFPGVEAVLLSTCNRTEFYLARPADHGPDGEQLRGRWAQRRGLEPDTLAAVTLLREQEPAVRHLFRVTAGLDSLVVGEPEVQHQVHRAYRAACDADTVGPVLHQVFQGAIASARKARADTGLSRAGASVGSVALQFARTVFAGFTDKTVVSLGAGEIAKATLRRLLHQQPRRTWIVNRNAERAHETAQALGLEPQQGGVRPWDDLDPALIEADVLVCATAAPQPVVTTARVKALLRKRKNRPLVVLDLAVPRDVEPGVGALSNVYLYNIDDLKEVVEHDPQRREAADRCERQTHDAARACLNALLHRNVGQLVRQLRQKMQHLADAEQQRSARKLAALEGVTDPVQHDALEALFDEFGHRLINKILHLPLQQMDTRQGDVSLGFYAAALRRLFDLEEAEAEHATHTVVPTDPNHDPEPVESAEPTEQTDAADTDSDGAADRHAAEPAVHSGRGTSGD